MAANPYERQVQLLVNVLPFVDSCWRSPCAGDVQSLAAATEIRLVPSVKRDKYDRRTIGRLYLDGADLSEMLLAEGLARPYGGDRREGWCAAEPPAD